MKMDRVLVLACVLVVVPAAWAQEHGVSAAQPVTAVDADPAPVVRSAPVVTPEAKPSGAIPYSQSEAYGPYVPLAGATASGDASSSAAAKPFDADGSIVTAESARRPLAVQAVDDSSADGQIVMHVPVIAGQIGDGTLIRVKLNETLSTLETKPGSRFSAVVSEPVMQEGKVYIPEGAVLEGRVTWVRGGKRVGGSAAIHLQPQTLKMPDGTQYMLSARVIDTSSWENTKVDREGTILKKDPMTNTAMAGGLAVGAGAAAGALIGGVPGALIGAGVGAGVTTIVWLREDRQAVLPKDLGLVFSLTEPMAMQPMRAAAGAVVGSGGE